ncbi:MAG: T9SS type A sorting domain-containing protein [Bacteroidota bacterium]
MKSILTFSTYNNRNAHKQILTLLAMLLMSSSMIAQIDWIKFTTHSDGGGFLTGKAIGKDMAIDQQDNIYVTGDYGGQAVFDDTTVLGTRDPIFLAKYNKDGGVEWVNEIGGNSNNHGNAVAVNDSGHVYFTGTFIHTNSNTILDFGSLTLAGDREENLFLAKVNADGTYKWAVAIIVDDLLGPDQIINPLDMVVDQNGDIYITGEMLGSVNIEGTKYNTDPLDIDNDVLFLAKYKPDGKLDWFRQTNNRIATGFARGYHLALAANGDIFLSGEYETVSYQGDTLPDVGLVSENNVEKFVARLNSSGDMLWLQAMNSRLGGQNSFEIGVDANDNVYTLLTINSNIYLQDTTILFPYDFQSPHLLVKFDGNGNRQFLRETGYPNANGSFGVQNLDLTTRDDGTTFMVGDAVAFADYMIFGDDSLDLKQVPNSSFNPTPFIAAFDANGHAIGVENYVDEHLGNLFSYEVMSAAMLTDHGKVFMTGYLNGDFRFGDDTVMTDVFDQLFLTQIDPAFLNTTTSIDRMPERLAFHVYPNPARDLVNVEVDAWQQAKGNVSISLLDLQGKMLATQELKSPVIQLDVSEYGAGYYVILLRDETGIYARKLQIW